MVEPSLQECRILVVEDEYFIADDMRRGLERAGASVVGPAASVEEGLALISETSVDAAILDVTLGEEKVFPIAAALAERQIPFVFATGYDPRDMPPEWRHVVRYDKPVNVKTIARALFAGSSS